MKNNILRAMYLEILCFALTCNIYEVFSFNQDTAIMPKFKIGIIGGGIGGTSTAYFLRNMKDAALHLYEPEKIGGRLQTTHSLKKNYETGGAIIHPENQYMSSFIEELGLKRTISCPSKLGVFDGKDYAFVESSWNIVNTFKMFWRYGLDVYWLNEQIKAMLKNFSRIYEIQSRGGAFETVDEMLTSMSSEFLPMANVSFRSYLKENKFNDLIINELITACVRTNYGQSTDIHALVGSVSIAAASPNLWSVAGGNKRVPEELLKQSQAKLLKQRVTKIAYLDSKFQVWSKSKDNVEETVEVYDAVTIATPLTKDLSTIEFVNFSQPFEFPGTYERLFCTTVEGKLNAKIFGVTADEILTDNIDLYYKSVGKQIPVDAVHCPGNEPEVYKVFSSQRLTEEQLSELFSNVKQKEVKEWLAYPKYDSRETLGKFQLVPGLYYNNVIERAASAIEMSIIAAKNSALLTSKYLMGDESQTTEQTFSKEEL